MSTSMQNYAKFDSRIEESLGGLSTSNDYAIHGSTNNSFFILIGNFLEFLYLIIIGIIIILGLFFLLYIIISLFTKGGEKTSQELKSFLNGAYNIIVDVFKKIFLKLNYIFSYIMKRKTISVLIILFLVLLNFLGNIVNGNSNILKLTKIGDSYVGVDIKNNKIIKPGYFLYSPITTNFFLSPTNNFDFEIAEVTANTSEELGVTLDYRVGFKIIDEKRLEFYKKYGAKDIKLVSSDIVMPRLLEIIKGIIKSYSFKDISSKHNEIKNITIDEANKILKPIGIELQEINILDIRLPDTYLKSKEDLLNADSELKLAEARLETQEKEAQRKLLEAKNLKSVKIIEAEAIAESNKIINSESITPEMLNMKKLENDELKINKWDGKLPASVGKEFDFLK
ncbi:MAG: SPFH domain-containing protein [Candidatus Gracilibacteria bacterium]|nr:SPFH domain-containing protein [Candidatus Gracilibacteria bacterium]